MYNVILAGISKLTSYKNVLQITAMNYFGKGKKITIQNEVEAQR